MNTNILVTNYEDSGEDVLIMTEEPLGAITVAFALTHKKKTFTEVYAIKEEERQYYLFDPLWMKKETVENTRKLAKEFIEANPKGSKLYEEIISKCGANKILNIKKLNCKETWSRYPKQFDFVSLFVAEMVDGTTFYTTKGGTEVFGTSEKLDSNSDISNVHDFQTINVPGGVQDEEHFRKIVESDAVVDLIC